MAGDVTYLAKFKVTHGSSGSLTEVTGEVSVENIDVAEEISVFPNPVRDNINIRYTVEGSQAVQAQLYDMGGRVVQDLFREANASGHNSRSIALSGQVTTGLYLLKMQMGDKTYFKKLLVE